MKKLKKLFLLFKLLKELSNLKNEMKIKVKKRRSCAVRKINRDRRKHGYFTVTFLKIKELDPEQFFVHTRMSKPIYNVLLELLKPFLSKNSIREPISAECRLSLTLLYLSQGTSIQSLSWSYKLGKTTTRKIILETCKIIWQTLFPIYVLEPTREQLEEIENDFWTMWNMPNCLGAIDGKHIAITCPPNSGSEFFNYKKFCSIVLMAAVDAKYIFTYVDVGAYGSQSDGGIFQLSSFGSRLLNQKLDMPPPTALPGTSKILPHYFVADAAFPLHINLMKPYPGQRLSKDQETFNARLSRARRVVENAFGVLVARWRILLSTINMLPENAEKVVLACIALHNFLKRNEESGHKYCPDNFIDWEDEHNILHHGLWREEIATNIHSIRPSTNQHTFGGKTSQHLRNELSYFVNNIHKLNWQNK